VLYLMGGWVLVCLLVGRVVLLMLMLLICLCGLWVVCSWCGMRLFVVMSGWCGWLFGFIGWIFWMLLMLCR